MISMLRLDLYSYAVSKASLKIDGVKDFNYGEMALATNDFDSSAQVGQGGYGRVYRGILANGTVVAIKRAQEGSLQGEKEFLTEIELLSRLHHRNLVSLLGFCDEEGEQVLLVVLKTYVQLRFFINPFLPKCKIFGRLYSSIQFVDWPITSCLKKNYKPNRKQRKLHK